MINTVKFAISVLALATGCLAQEGLTIDNKHKERVSIPEAEQIYFSACSAVREEFDLRRSIPPRVKLILGGDKNEVWVGGREIRLTKWDRYAFAEGVVQLAFEDIMPSQQRLTIAKRAIVRVDSTVEVERLVKYLTGLPPVVENASSGLLRGLGDHDASEKGKGKHGLYPRLFPASLGARWQPSPLSSNSLDQGFAAEKGKLSLEFSDLEIES